MGVIKTLADATWRDWNTDGVPSTGVFEVLKSGIRAFFTTLEVWLAGDDIANVKLQHGGVGNGVANDTAAILAAVATGKSVYLSAGTYLVTDIITLAAGQRLFGAGRLLTTILVNNTFDLTELAVIKATQAEPGPIIEDIGIRFVQPDTAVRANLVAYPRAIDMSNAARGSLRRLRIEGAMSALWVRGNFGGGKIRDVEISCFDYGISVDGSLDHVKVTGVDFYPFGLTANQTTIMFDATTIGLDLGRVDGLQGGDISGVSMQKLIYARASGSGDNCRGALSNIGSDDCGILITAGELILNGISATAVRAVTQTLRVEGDGTNFATAIVGGLGIRSLVASTNPLINLNNAGITASLIVNGLKADMAAYDIVLAKSQGGSASRLNLTGVDLLHTSNVAYTKPIIHMASGRGTIASVNINDKGTGAGNVIQIDTADTIKVSDINATGWGIILPAGVPMEYTDTGSPEGSQTAPIGSRFNRTDAAPALYVKQSGTGNTGWSAILTASGFTLTGQAAFQDGALWNASGLSNAASYSTVADATLSWTPTWNFSSTGNGIAPLVLSPVLVPTGASAGNVNAMNFAASLGTSAVNQSTLRSIAASVTTAAGYSGVLSNAHVFSAGVTQSGPNAIGTTAQFIGNGTANGNGITSGTVNNYGLNIGAHTAAAGPGGTVNNYGGLLTLGSGSSAGTTNYGLKITGNGGASATANYAIYSDSTALSSLAAKLTATLLNGGSYTVATLPAGAAGDISYASDGRKNGEGAASGTGVQVFKDGSNWRAVDTGATVAA